MFVKSKIAAIALTSSLLFAGATQANEVSLEEYVTSAVNQAMLVAHEELQNSVRSAVLTMTHNVSFSEDNTYATKVTITDLENSEATKTKAE